jgi:site-specific recombinase XerD
VRLIMFAILGINAAENNNGIPLFSGTNPALISRNIANILQTPDYLIFVFAFASKKLERLRSILKFALRRKWITDNPASELDSPRLRPTPTLPFTQEETDPILEAASGDPRVHAFVLTMLYSGLRISDTTSLPWKA